MDVKIRDCTIADAKDIAEIYNEAIRFGGSTMDDEEKSEEYFKKMILNFNKRETFLILENSDEVFGWGIIKRYSDRFGYRFCCETSVYLKRNFLRMGFGSMMKKALIEKCREFHYRHMVGKIFSENKASIEYNLRLGYEIVGTQREIGFKDGKWTDVTIMQLILDDVEPKIPEKYL